MILGYGTNGFAHHSLEDALSILADIGYRSVAITLDRHHLNPLDDGWPARAARVKKELHRWGLRNTVETGGRYALDTRRKHQPTMISGASADRDRRIEFLCRAIDVSMELESDCISLWSGAADDDAEHEVLFDRLLESLQAVLAHAEIHDMPVAFEPEPGMFIERMDQFDRLYRAVDHPLFGLTLDVGHVHCLADGDLLSHLQRWSSVLLNVHLEDMRHGTHEHLFFGEGQMNFTEVIGMLSATEYRGAVHVELSRHSHEAPEVAARAYAFLSALWPTA